MKAPYRITRKYYKSYRPFTRPDLTTNVAIGVSDFGVTASSVYSSEYAIFKAVDNNDTETRWISQNQYTEANGTHWYEFYSSKPLLLPELWIYNHPQSTYYNTTTTLKASNDNINWVTLSTYSNNSWVQYYKMQGSSTTAYKYWKLADITGYGSMGECWITDIKMPNAQIQDIVESDETDYDFYKDVFVTLAITDIIRKYYKNTDEIYTAPIINTNGIIGTDDFAVEGHKNYSWGNINTYAYRLFDGTTSIVGCGASDEVIIYSKKVLCITQMELYQVNYIDHTYANTSYFKTIEFYASNDNSDYKFLGSTTNNSGGNKTLTITTDNADYYNYYKLKVVSANTPVSSTDGYMPAMARYMTLIGTQRTTVESDETDYDFYKDVLGYKAIV